MHTSIHPLDPLLGEIETHAHLDQAEREAVLHLPYRLRGFEAGAYLVREGDRPQHCYVLADGYAIRQKVTGTGARQILAICIPGDAIDLQNLATADHGIQMLTHGKVAELPRQAVRDLVVAHPKIGAGIIQMSLVEASILREWVVNVGRRHARERIAHVLCEIAVRLEARGLDGMNGFELPMSQEQLADVTGLTPVHVNRVLKGLETEGLISRQRRRISFADWRALQDAGDFSQRYLHLSEPPIAVAAQ